MKFQSIGKAVVPFAMLVGLGMSQAQAADLGGDCCADLEERIAELEATTVRKGNRKVSLKLSGHVNRAILWFDNGRESNVYSVDNGDSSTRFRLTGGAAITTDIDAGFNIELGVYGARSISVTEDDDDAGSRVAVRKAYWYLNSKSLGKLTVGTLDMASDDIAEIDLGGINSPAYFNNVGVAASLGVYTTANVSTGLAMKHFFPGEQTGDDIDGVRYDSPTIMGAKFSASWGEDDMWDVALRYAGEVGDFRVAAGVAYFVDRESTTDFAGILGTALGTRYNKEAWGASASVEHAPTGLFVDVAYSKGDYDYLDVFVDAEVNEWSVAAGITQKFVPFGDTTGYIEYAKADTDFSLAGTGRVLTLEASYWGLGFVQEIDAAAMELYAGYRHFEFDVDVVGNNVPLKDVDVVIAGAKIKF